MNELPREAIPLPMFVDHWVLEQCHSQDMTFENLALEALTRMRDLQGDDSPCRTPVDASLEDWLVAEADWYGGGIADRYTWAICILCEERTGVNLLGINDEWLRVPPDAQQRAHEQKESEELSEVEFERRRAQARERYETNSAAWRAAGRPPNPWKVWDKAIAALVVPEDERFNVYVWPEKIGENLTGDEASALLRKAQRSTEYQNRSVNDFASWPVSAEPMPAGPIDRFQAHLLWLRSLGLTAPYPGDDTPEGRAWEAWTSQRARLRGRR